MAKRRFLLPMIVLLAALAAGGAWLYARRPGSAVAAGLTLYGNVDIRELQLAFDDSGRITRVLVPEGARVRRGQLLATLDPVRYAAALAQARGQMENQRQVVAALIAGSRPEQIAQARAAMKALAATWRNDLVNYRRAVALAATGAGTIQQRDNALEAFQTALQQYEAARQAYILAVKGPRAEDIAAARGAYQAAVAAVALAEIAFRDTRLRAPAAGVVEDRILEPGDMASPATPVYTLALPSPLWVRADVPEADLGRVRPGEPATVTTDSFPGRRYHGWIGYVAPTAEFTPKTVQTPQLRTALVYQMRVYVCDAKGELRLGMPATVHLAAVPRPGAPPPGCLPRHAAHP